MKCGLKFWKINEKLLPIKGVQIYNNGLLSQDFGFIYSFSFVLDMCTHVDITMWGMWLPWPCMKDIGHNGD